MIPGKNRLMEAIQQAEDRLQTAATYAFTKLYRFDIEETNEFELSNGESIPVYWFSRDSSLAGKMTPVGTVLLNRSYFAKLSPDTQELVVRHELGHVRRSAVMRGIFWGMVIIGAFGIYSLLSAAGFAVLGASLSVVSGLATVGGISTAGFLLTNRLEETAADLYALRVLGEDAFIDGYEEIADATDYDQSIVMQAWKAISYTDPELVVRLNERLSWLPIGGE